MRPLTKRLQTALDLLPPCHCVADVGCDHGLATQALLEQGICQRAIATDISAPSLAKAQARLRRAGLLDNVTFACCDGLARAGQADAALILGMGGRTIVDILRDAPAITARLRCVVIQPASHAPLVYQALPGLGLCVSNEIIVRENGRFFPLIALQPGDQPPLKGAAALLGPVNCARRDEATLQYAAWLRAVYEKTLRVPGRTPESQNDQQKAAECLRALTGFQEGSL